MFRKLISSIFLAAAVFTAAAPAGLAVLVPASASAQEIPYSLEQPSSCSGWTDFFTFKCVAKLVASFFLYISSALLTFAGLIFNYTLVFTVLQMGNLVNGLTGVTIAWQVVRDIANLIFIFGLLVIGIATILRVSGYGYKTLLRNLVIAAILVNFSMLFAKFVIDISNIAAAEIYSQIQSGGNCASSESYDATACLNQGIANQFYDKLRISSVYDTQGVFQNAEVATQIILIGIFGSIFLVISAFIIFAAALLLAIRFVVLIILIILSPIGIAGMVLPQTQSYARQWWDKLFSQSLFAPAYLFMVWVTLTILSQSFVPGTTGATFSEALTKPGVGSAEIFFNFTIATVLMVSSLIIAAKMGAYGAGGIMKFGKNMALSAAGVMGARTAGTLSHRFRVGYDRFSGNMATLNDTIEGNETLRRGRRYFNIGAGAVTLGGYTAAKSMIKAAHKEGIPSALKAGEEHKFAGTHSYKSLTDSAKAREKEVSRVARNQKQQSALNNLANIPAGSVPDQQAISTLQSASAEDFEKLATSSLDDKQRATLMQYASSGQIESLLGNKEVSEGDKAKVRKHRYGDAMETAAAAAAAVGKPEEAAKTAEAKNAYRNLSAQELENLFASGHLTEQQMTQMSSYLPSSHWEAVKKSSKISPALRAALDRQGRSKKFYDALDNIASSDPTTRTNAETNLKDELKRMSAQDIENLFTSGSLTEQQMISVTPHLPGGHWEALRKSNKIDQRLKEILVEQGRYKQFHDAVRDAVAAPTPANRTAFSRELKQIKVGIGEISDTLLKNIINNPRLLVMFANNVSRAQLKAIDDRDRLKDADAERERLKKAILRDHSSADDAAKSYFNTTAGRNNWP